MDKLFPEFDMWTQFVSMDFDGALGLDALKNSHPIEVRFHTTFLVAILLFTGQYSLHSNI